MQRDVAMEDRDAAPWARPRTLPTAGDLQADDMERLRQQLGRAVERVCPRWLAGYREDLVQASLVKILERRRRGEEIERLPASYLWKVAYSATVDQIRRLRRREELPMEPVGRPSTGAGQAPRDPDAERERRELGRSIRACLQRLSQRRRMVVGLALIGHRAVEIERLLGFGAKVVDNLLYRGLADLRRCLVQKGWTP